MKLRSVKISKKFIPEFNDNMELPDSERGEIHINTIPGTSEKSNYKGFKFDQSAGVQLMHNDQMLVSSFVERIENLENVEGKLIKNGAELSSENSPELSDLFDEIRNYLFPDDDFSEKESNA